MKILKCKAAVRSITILDPQTLIVGENEGWFELVRVSNNIELVDITTSKKIDAVGHVFTLQPTHEPYQVVVCSYTGIHFVKMELEEKTLKMMIMLQDLSYETEQFVNRIIEYSDDKYMAVSWDNNKYIFIDHKQESITSIVNHPAPDKFNVRCWGLQKVVDFDCNKMPWLISRDNCGFVLINVRTYKSYMLYESAITVNLYGHGDILRVCKTNEPNRFKIVTLVQDTNS